jgi:hypothetical protein
VTDSIQTGVSAAAGARERRERHGGAARAHERRRRCSCARPHEADAVCGRGLHSLTSELNLRTLGNTSLPLELNLSTFGPHPRGMLDYTGDTVSSS